jgi:hypothetical protein
VIKILKKKEDGIAYNWLVPIPLNQWCRHALLLDSKSEHIINNMTESFNAWVLKIRGLPIVNLIDAIRQKCMTKLHHRYAKGCTWEGPLVPNAKK